MGLADSLGVEFVIGVVFLLHPSYSWQEIGINEIENYQDSCKIVTP